MAAVAETNHPPFDLVEAEQELTGGFMTEYTGIRFAIFYLAEFMNLITMSAIAVTLFFGGPAGPGLGFLAADNWVNVWVMPVFWFMLKVLVLLFATVWLRATLPRLRYDQLMGLGWKYLIEIAFLWVMVSAVVVVGKEEGWPWASSIPAAVAGALVLGGILYALHAPQGRDRRGDQVMGGAARGLRRDVPPDRRKKVTEEYPKEKAPKPARQHGRHVLNRYEDGMEKCIGCELCAGVCPAKCIYVRGADNPPDAPVSPGERYGFVYEINYLRCIHCDLCVEACPTEAITETKLFEFSFTNRSDAIYTKAELARRRRRPRPPPAVGAVARRRGRRHQRVDARTAPAGNARLRGPRRLVGRARLRRARRRAGPVGRAPARRPHGAARRTSASPSDRRRRRGGRHSRWTPSSSSCSPRSRSPARSASC